MTAEQLQQKIKDKGLKQSFLAEKLGISEGRISQFVNGTHTIPKKHLTALKKLL